jgi:hypothetical protein
MMQNRLYGPIAAWSAPILVLIGATGCIHVSSDPIEVKPIHIVADINLRIDRQLDDFFSFEQKYAAIPVSTTQPSTATTQQSL